MKQRRESIRKWMPELLSVLLVFGVLTVFGACGMKDDGTWMKCHGAQKTVAKVCGAIPPRHFNDRYALLSKYKQ